MFLMPRATTCGLSRFTACAMDGARRSPRRPRRHGTKFRSAHETRYGFKFEEYNDQRSWNAFESLLRPTATPRMVRVRPTHARLSWKASASYVTLYNGQEIQNPRLRKHLKIEPTALSRFAR